MDDSRAGVVPDVKAARHVAAAVAVGCPAVAVAVRVGGRLLLVVCEELHARVSENRLDGAEPCAGRYSRYASLQSVLLTASHFFEYHGPVGLNLMYQSA